MSDDKQKKPKERTLNVVNQLKLDPNDPIPIQYGGDSFVYIRGKKYIPFLGKNNNLPNLLLEARLTSATQDRCIQDIASAVVGNGITILEEKTEGDSATTKKKDSVKDELFKWMKCVNNDSDSLDDILLETVDGEREQGNQFIEIQKGSVGATAYMKIFLHPLQNCRFKELEKGQTNPSHVIISKMFAKRGYRVTDNSREIPLWSSSKLEQKKCWLKETDGSLRTMLHFKNNRKGIDHYGMPASVAGLRYQVLEGKSAQYNIDNFENNMILGGMLMFKSAMTEEEALLNAERIMLSHIGAGKTGRIAVISSETGLEDVKFEKYDTKNDGSYIELDDKIEQKIIACNGWHPALLGYAKGSTHGNGSGYIRSIWDTVEAKTLNPLRRRMVDKVVAPIMKIYAEVFNEQKVLDYNFWFNSAMPFSFLGDIDPEQFMQVNEARGLGGLEVDPEMKGKYLGEMKKSNTANKITDQPEKKAK